MTIVPKALLDLLGQLELLPGHNLLTSIAQKMCSKIAISKMFCRNILFLLGGFNTRLLKAVSASAIRCLHQ